MLREITNIQGDIKLLSEFLKNAGKSLISFRYFNNRPIEVISIHVYTILILDEERKPVAYGHLDPDGVTIWLGICVTETAMGQGYGNQVMSSLIKKAHEIGIKEITLKVDTDNYGAITLYKKHNFVIVEGENKKFHIMKLIIHDDK